eukprot:Polyplicarium_translucidae@DN3223_c0_g1_i1.p1
MAAKITRLDETAMTSEEEEYLIQLTCREVTLQRKLKHEHIVEMKCCFEINPRVLVAILDLSNERDIDDYLHKHGPIPEGVAKLWTSQILRGLQYIHEVGNVVHFDLKPHNILVHDGRVKISDFGLHQAVGTQGKALMDMRDKFNHVGTVWYMPPEHIEAALAQQHSEFDGRFDVWSAGVILFEMLFRRRPFGARSTPDDRVSHDHIAALIAHEFRTKGLLFPAAPAVSEACKRCLSRMLSPSAQRPTARKALDDPWFNSTTPPCRVE